MARSLHRRSADQNAALHLLSQKRCGLPPRRGRNGVLHQSQIIEVLQSMALPRLPRSHCASCRHEFRQEFTHRSPHNRVGRAFKATRGSHDVAKAGPIIEFAEATASR
jgi:hypothetical protein